MESATTSAMRIILITTTNPIILFFSIITESVIKIKNNKMFPVLKILKINYSKEWRHSWRPKDFRLQLNPIEDRNTRVVHEEQQQHGKTFHILQDN